MLQGCGLAELGGSVRKTGDVEGRGADGSLIKGQRKNCLINTKFNLQVLVNSIILQFAVQNSVCIICKLP